VQAAAAKKLPGVAAHDEHGEFHPDGHLAARVGDEAQRLVDMARRLRVHMPGNLWGELGEHVGSATWFHRSHQKPRSFNPHRQEIHAPPADFSAEE
jgi:hypothetical protein